MVTPQFYFLKINGLIDDDDCAVSQTHYILQVLYRVEYIADY